VVEDNGNKTLTIKQAEAILRELASAKSVCMTTHFRHRLRSRQFSVQDAYKVLSCGRIEESPKWNEEKGNFAIRVRGTVDGMDIRVVLGVRADGSANFVTITEIGA